MTSTWEFSRADFPSSVRGLMSLWGGFDEPANVTDSGCEKRLEIDIQVEAGSADLHSVTKDQWAAVLASIQQSIIKVQGSQNAVQAFHTAECLLLVVRDKVIVTSSATVLLHQLLTPLMRVCTQVVGAHVEWSSFMRKNTASPWEPDNAMNHVMASEYADLKNTFPQGRSFLIGPVDGDHYFYFVHDAVNRKRSAVVEDDVQVNLVMYNVQLDTELEPKNVTQDCVVLPAAKGEYETLRFFNACGQPCATFETNTSSEDHANRIASLLELYKPDRCTLITLFDPSTNMARRLAKGDRCGLDKFENFTVENRCTNEFAHGYVVRKTMLTRCQ